jgi:hypothetical protein
LFLPTQPALMGKLLNLEGCAQPPILSGGRIIFPPDTHPIEVKPL